MKRLLILLLFFSAAFAGKAQYSQYEVPNNPEYTRSEIRQLLLKQEKKTAVWELARSSQVSTRWAVITTIVGAMCLVGGYAGYTTMSHESLLSYMNEIFYQGMMAVGAVNLGVSVWQFKRADRKLDQAIKLYYGE